MIKLFKRKEIQKNFLTEEDINTLEEVERVAYVEAAKELAKIRGIENAKKDFNVKKEEKKPKELW